MNSVSFEAKIQETITRHALFSPGQTVVVAVSGGPDSTALLHAMTVLRAEWNLSLIAAHLNHGFRGAESDGDADYAAELCARLEVPCQIAREDVPARRKRLHLSAQEAARQARHAFLRRVAEETGAARIAVGHTRDDRLETVLLNLLRGTGLEGLGGFPPLQPPLVRPLYDVTRAEIQAYCAVNDLHPRSDSSNAKLDYRRNRIRAELLPTLTTYYNEKAGEAILRLSDLATADNDLLEALAKDARERITQEQTPSRIALDRRALCEVPPALRRRVVRQAIAHARGHLRDVGFQLVEQVLEMLAASQANSLELPSDGAETVSICCSETLLTITRASAAASALPWQIVLPIPGRAEIPAAGIALETQVCTTLEEARALAEARLLAPPVRITGANRRVEPILVRLADLNLPLTARSWRSGDRLRPAGIGGSKKVQDLFTDGKIPAAGRNKIPILVDSGGNGRIFAVPGVHRDEMTLKITRTDTEGVAEAGQVLMITALPL